MANKVANSSTFDDKIVSKRRDLDWICRPLFIWMGILGIHPLSPDTSVIKHILALVLRYGLWTLFVGVTIAINVIFFQGLLQDANDINTQTSFWNKCIENVNWAVCNIGIHSWIIFFVLWKNKWSQLHNLLSKIEISMMESCQPSFSDSSNLRKIAFAFTVYIVIAVKNHFNVLFLIFIL